MRAGGQAGLRSHRRKSSGLVRPGVSELELAAEIDYRMRRKGASGPSFDTIVASGPRSALPHAQPTRKAIAEKRVGRPGPGCYTPPLLQ